MSRVLSNRTNEDSHPVAGASSARRGLVVFFDSKNGRGGGQVVLEEILDRLNGEVRLGLVMTAEGQSSITIPRGVEKHVSLRDFANRSGGESDYLLISNAHSSMPAVLKARRMLVRLGARVRTMAIMHNYPERVSKLVATRALLSRFDQAIAVEPGLARLRPDAVVPSWLSNPGPAVDLPEVFSRTGVVKCYARPDKSKGLHLLPEIFSILEKEGVVCQVAIGSALQDQGRYRSRLESHLSPWLMDGPRTSAWIEPGDLFLVPSVAGEAVCLAAQESMAKGAVVIASRVGLLPYLSPKNKGIRTFAVGDFRAAAAACLSVLTMHEEAFVEECREGSAQMRDRAGTWYDDLTALVVDGLSF